MNGLIKYIFCTLVLVTSVQARAEPEWVELGLLVVDDSGRLVVDASVRGLFYEDSSRAHRPEGVVVGATDVEGRLTISGKGYMYVDVLVEKLGYYDTRHRVFVSDLASLAGNDRLQIRLRERMNPIPMYAKRTVFLLPGRDNGEVYGYDFVRGDFVTPHGDGLETDVELTYVREFNNIHDFSWTLTVRFPNPTDGLIPQGFNALGSEYRSGHRAPSDGYRTEWIVSKSRGRERESPPKTADLNREAFYFRVRTQVDDSGDVVGGYYGKIYGGFPKATYYLNPDRGDRNVEWDSAHNRFGTLPLMERVAAP